MGAARQKILFIGINQRYINATHALVPAMIQRHFDLHFYGPGFVAPEIVERGIDKYVERLGGIDYVVVTAQCVINTDVARFNKFLRGSTAVLNDGRLSAEFLNDVVRFCKNHRQRVICAMSDVDPHVTPQWMLDRLFEHAAFFMAWGKGFLNAKSDMEQVKNERYIQKKLNKGFQLGLLDEFARVHADRFINLGHFVADNEFYWAALSARTYDVAIPGSGYARRRRVSTRVKKVEGLRVAPARYQYPFKIAGRLGLRPFANFYALHLYNLAFQRLMSRSKCCITEGGANNYPVRKFFEIPASGALMVCWPAVGMESLGFKDGVNCIFLRDDEQIIAILRALTRDIGRFEPLAAAGRELVLRQHSVAARSVQFHEAIKRIDAGSFRGSSWHAGIFSCDPELQTVVSSAGSSGIG